LLIASGQQSATTVDYEGQHSEGKMTCTRAGVRIFHTGCLLAIIGLLLLSPLADFVPVELLLALQPQQVDQRSMFMRVAPGTATPFLAIGVAVGLVGVAAITLGCLSRSKSVGPPG
jgi:hypothetical protein